MILSEGRIAENGYYIAQADITVYSVEELAWVCAHKGYTLNKEFASEKLVAWIREECEAEVLAGRLNSIRAEHDDTDLFVEAILRYTACYSERQIEKILKDISEGLGMSGYEHKKQEADRLYENRRYAGAVKAYQELLELLPEGEQVLRAAVYYNLGAAKAQLFLFEEAMEAMERSYELAPEKGTLFGWLAAARMGYSEKDYLALISNREDLYELSLELEEEMKKNEITLLKNGAGKELEKLREWMQYGGEEGYYVASGRMLRELCAEYKSFFQ